MPRLVLKPKPLPPAQMVEARKEAAGGDGGDERAMIEQDQQRLRALKLRLEDKTYVEIGQELNIGRVTASRYVNEAWGGLLSNFAELQSQRLNDQDVIIDRIKMALLPFLNGAIKLVEQIRQGQEVITVDIEEFKKITWASNSLIKVLQHEAAIFGLRKDPDSGDKGEMGPLTLDRNVFMWIYGGGAPLKEADVREV